MTGAALTPLGPVDRNDGGILLATQLGVVRCSCGHVHFQLFGLEGQRFAEAQMPAETALAIAMQIISAVRTAGGPAGGVH